jgi:hypothetical protein
VTDPAAREFLASVEKPTPALMPAHHESLAENVESWRARGHALRPVPPWRSHRSTILRPAAAFPTRGRMHPDPTVGLTAMMRALHRRGVQVRSAGMAEQGTFLLLR